MGGLGFDPRRVAGLDEWSPGRLARVALSNAPVVVVLFAVVAWLFASNGVFTRYESFQVGTFLNPVRLSYAAFLSRGWETFVGNVQLWIPFGVALTLLTSNRHVFGVAVGAYALTQVMLIAIVCNGYGMNVVVFAVIAATLFRAVGYLLRNASREVMENALVGLAVPAIMAVFAYEFLTSGSFIGNTAGFMFGAGIEILWVIHDYGGSTTERPMPASVA